jgi:transcriptional regulator with XRE-family HTH domain
VGIGRRFGANLNQARRASGLSQERLAVVAGVHRTEIGLLERGLRIPRIDTVLKLARALEIGPGELLIGINPSPERKGHIAKRQRPDRQTEGQDKEQSRPTE